MKTKRKEDVDSYKLILHLAEALRAMNLCVSLYFNSVWSNRALEHLNGIQERKSESTTCSSMFF